MGKVFINGRFADINSAKISVFDRSFLYGDAVFETMRAYAGIVFKLNRHLDRLLGSLKVLKIKHGFTKECLKGSVYRTLNANKLKSAYIRLVVTRGEGRFGNSSGQKKSSQKSKRPLECGRQGIPACQRTRRKGTGLCEIRQKTEKKTVQKYVGYPLKCSLQGKKYPLR